ncbi:MAG: hypothetical protein U5L00_17875 [Desulfovermiculus sp.]|nr:hypothetical protein [Desulfovermiculus sp.]
MERSEMIESLKGYGGYWDFIIIGGKATGLELDDDQTWQEEQVSALTL